MSKPEMTPAQFAEWSKEQGVTEIIHCDDDGPLWSDVFGTNPIRMYYFCENAEQFANVMAGLTPDGKKT